MNSPADDSLEPHVVRRWPGLVLSILIPGAGIFFGGDRVAGLCWFFGLHFLGFLVIFSASLRHFPLGVTLALAIICLVLAVWMLVRSFRPVRRLGFAGWVLVVLISFALGWSGTVLDRRLSWPFRISTGSMAPTLIPGDRIFAQTCCYWFSTPQRGEIVVFNTDLLRSSLLPAGQFYAKRVAAVGGEKLQIVNGGLMVNGKPIQAAGFLSGTNFWMEQNQLLRTENELYLVPPNSCFVVGDNATNSYDSRHYGAIPNAAVMGRVTKIYWPLSRAGDVR